ncbi:MAG TPA: hypothetical protein PLO67_09190 [Saprospiraceae bacterium]|nr:hypothetical protein [Saprospiraceae bacterium]HPI05342.1 hypothetical protein [Saprospiraceae bacterium]
MKINPLRAFTMLLACLCLSSLHAQDAPKREVGIQLYGLNFNGNNSFSAFYKKQLSANKYRRINFFTGRANTNVSDEEVQANVNIAAAIGFEKRKSLDEKLEFYRGPEFSINTGFLQINNQTVLAIAGGFGYVLGLQHSFNSRWAIQVETIPAISLGLTFVDRSYDSRQLDANISNSVALGVARKF